MNNAGDAFDPESFVPLLETIRTMLIKHEFVDQGTVVAQLIDLAHLGSEQLPEKLRGGDVWGSAGSVADVVGLQRSFEPRDVETERDSIELTESLVLLADKMQAHGMSSERVDFLADAFRRGLEERRPPTT